MSSQNDSASNIASWTLGLSKLRSGWWREEAVPEVLLADRVPGPVRRLGVDEDDPRVLVELVGVGPDVEVAVGTLRVLAAGLEPRVLVGGVVHDEVDDHPDAARVRRVEEVVEVLDGADLGEDVGVVGDVVAAVAQGRGEERRDPQAVDAEPLEVVELLDQALEVADAVAVAVLEGADQHLVEDGGLEPVRRGPEPPRSSAVSSGRARCGWVTGGASGRSGRGRARGRGRAGRSCARPRSRTPR